VPRAASLGRPADFRALIAVGPPAGGPGVDGPYQLALVVAEMVSPMPYTALNGAFDPHLPEGHPQLLEGAFVAELTDEAIAAHLESHRRCPR
jgi:hypothetical protein